ncbi:MAG: AAA family ATPase [Planctomycetes bacterium]|nr:AAA family ATPase [Planctomycetota bacterium]
MNKTTTAATPVQPWSDMCEVLTQPVPTRSYLLDHLIPEDGVVMVGAASKLGKRLLVDAIAVAAATGTEVLGHRVAPARPVLLISREDSMPMIHRRVAAMLAIRGVDLPPRMLCLWRPG